ncbi:MAG: DUF4982 domain-containing protein [Clostridiales bacterium]|nr:DUF4982 domain-containing protein [Clostridiales bacterium]
MRKKINDGWFFQKLDMNTPIPLQTAIQTAAPVRLPHDWLIGCGNLYEDGIGYYHKYMMIEKSDRQLVFLRFDGVYMDSVVFVNGRRVGEWKYGYTTFEVEITEALVSGENHIEVYVRYQSPNSRWYTGAGIYRNVWLKTVDQTHILSDGIYVTSSKLDKDTWRIQADIDLCLSGHDVGGDHEIEIAYRIYRPADLASPIVSGAAKIAASDTAHRVCIDRLIHQPDIWDIDHPDCYELRIELTRNRILLQREIMTIGFRECTFSPGEGFLLNGRKLKLNGVCDHHDLGCLGSAFYVQAMERKLSLLKKMGVNAIRLSHNMPAPEVMELCDRLGFLVVSEAFDMWESSKTAYDYARFFQEWYQRDVRNWVLRDRNHPSLILWSIGNEIYDTHISKKGQEWTRLLMEEVEKYDPRQNAKITMGSNYMPWENAQKCADIIKIVGYNYGEKYYDLHHKLYPDWVIYGSETGSVVQSRGIYHFPYSQSVLTDEDEQCSALGNSTTSWGAASAEACLKAEIDHPYSCGQFIWTGTDYIGEPTPYHTRTSYFGQIDTAGFAKDSYYIYQAGWTDYHKAPMIHIFPYWDFNVSQWIDVRVCSNAPMVELFCNGNSMGIHRLDQQQGTAFAANYRIPYQEGVLLARAYDEEGNTIACAKESSFGDTDDFRVEKLWIRNRLYDDEEDLVFFTICAVDQHGNPVRNANDEVEIEPVGGILLGTDNGDSTDCGLYTSHIRRLFSGRLLAVCQGEDPERMDIRVTPTAHSYVRNIYLQSAGGTRLTPQRKEVFVEARISPQKAEDQALFYDIVDDAGIPLKIARLYPQAGGVQVEAVSDGKCRLRCYSKSGTDKIRIISALEFQIEGFGRTFTDPYDFVSAGLYSFYEGAIGNGNEHGVATARDGVSVIGFADVDFGSFGSDEIHLPIFALSDEAYRFRIYEHHQEEHRKELIGEFVYQKPSVWNVYQTESYRLDKKLKGVATISFEWNQKVHFKGFWFTRKQKAYEPLRATDYDKLYGDSYTVTGTGICGIGNNVTICFTDMDFGETGTTQVVINGRTPLPDNMILLQFEQDGVISRRMIEFHGRGVPDTQSFSFERITGRNKVSFVFLPGSKFDFYSLQFIQE